MAQTRREFTRNVCTIAGGIIAAGTGLERLVRTPEQPIPFIGEEAGPYGGVRHVYQLGAYTDRTILQAHVRNLQKEGMKPLVQRISPDGKELYRLFLNKDLLTEDQEARVRAYITGKGGDLFEMSVIDGQVINWTLRERAIRKTITRFERETVHGFPYREIVEEVIGELYPAVGERMREQYTGLIGAVMAVESEYDPLAKSGSGARGLMQVMPHMVPKIQKNLDWHWGRATGNDLTDPVANIRLGATLLKDELRHWAREFRRQEFDEHVLTYALASYNAGRREARRYLSSGRTNRETQEYPLKVLATLHTLNPPD